MRKDELIRLCSDLGIAPNKKLGQNFLIDTNMLNFIVRIADIKYDDVVLEIGPGLGILTEQLTLYAKRVVSVELDNKLFTYLKNNLTAKNLTLIHADILKINLNELFGNCDFRIISNMPYAISTPFLMKLINSNTIPNSMLLLLQDECAERFTAKPNSAQYNSASVLAQIFFKMKKIRKIPPDVFFPKPDVYSALVKFEKILNPLPSRLKVDFLVSLIKTAFSKRRKTLINNLSAHFDKQKIYAFLEKNNLSPSSRAQNLLPEHFIKIAEVLS